jgi:3-hydroxyisobutyrate dehydrogenase
VTVGFIGLGVMGRPMAARLARTGVDLAVWSRTRRHCDEVAALGARSCERPEDVFASADEGVILMLADEAATDAVLVSGPGLKGNVRRRTVINMGTMAPAWSEARARDVEEAGGEWVEAPVSGSRGPAEAGELVAMLAGRDAVIERVRPLLEPLCREIFVCGRAPDALRTKLAVNLFLITMVTGLVEAVHLARRSALDLEVFRAILDAGPMASAVSRGKLDKLIRGDFAVQASIPDVLKNSRLVEGAAREAGAAAPLISVCSRLYEAAEQLGAHDLDMAAVIHALEHRAA